MDVERLLTLAGKSKWMEDGVSQLERFLPLKLKKRDATSVRKLDVERTLKGVEARVVELAEKTGSAELARSLSCAAIICAGVDSILGAVRTELLADESAPPRQSSIAHCVRLYAELEAVRCLVLESCAELPALVAGGSDLLPSLAGRADAAAKAAFTVLERQAALLPSLALEEPTRGPAADDGAGTSERAKRDRRLAQNVAALAAVARAILDADSGGAAITERLMDRLGVSAAA